MGIKEVREMKGEKKEGRGEREEKGVYQHSFQKSVPVIPTRSHLVYYKS